MTDLDSELLARRLPLAGTRNVRDVGGYPVGGHGWTRRGLLFRGDSLHTLSDEGQHRLAEHGVKTIVDLRTDAERAAYADRLPPGVRVVVVPILDSLRDRTPATPVAAEQAEVTRLPDLADSYRFFVDQRGERIARVVSELAEPGVLPALVHCMAGKDRTGVVIALVLSALGVADDMIAADYAATGKLLGDEYRAEAVARAAARGLDETQYARLLTCEPELILKLLEYVRGAFGGAAAYLIQHGLTQPALRYLRGELVSPDLEGGVVRYGKG